ncbi:MAG: C39 family peptidase [Bacteriovoracia bacterium]
MKRLALVLFGLFLLVSNAHAVRLRAIATTEEYGVLGEEVTQLADGSYLFRDGAAVYRKTEQGVVTKVITAGVSQTVNTGKKVSVIFSAAFDHSGWIAMYTAFTDSSVGITRVNAANPTGTFQEVMPWTFSAPILSMSLNEGGQLAFQTLDGRIFFDGQLLATATQGGAPGTFQSLGPPLVTPSGHVVFLAGLNPPSNPNTPWVEQGFFKGGNPQSDLIFQARPRTGTYALDENGKIIFEGAIYSNQFFVREGRYQLDPETGALGIIGEASSFLDPNSQTFDAKGGRILYKLNAGVTLKTMNYTDGDIREIVAPSACIAGAAVDFIQFHPKIVQDNLVMFYAGLDTGIRGIYRAEEGTQNFGSVHAVINANITGAKKLKNRERPLQTVIDATLGDIIFLDGRASTEDQNNDMAFVWLAFREDDSSPAPLDGPTYKKTNAFTPTEAGNYRIQLSVANCGNSTDTAELLVRVGAFQNHPPQPTASPNPVTVRPGVPATITISPHDPDAGQTMTYAVVNGGSSHGTASVGLHSGIVTYTADANTTATSDSFVVNVQDNYSIPASGQVTVNVQISREGDPNAVTAKITAPIDALIHDSFHLSGASSTPQGGLTYEWTVKPKKGAARTYSGAEVDVPTGDDPDTYPIKLTVRDSSGASSTATASVKVGAIAHVVKVDRLAQAVDAKYKNTPWKKDIYDSSTNTIGKKGCFLSSIAMLIKANGVDAIPLDDTSDKSQEVTPGGINSWFSSIPNFFNAKHDPQPDEIKDAMRSLGLVYDKKDSSSFAEVETLVLSGEPVILHIEGFPEGFVENRRRDKQKRREGTSHFVVANGIAMVKDKNGNFVKTLAIIDPGKNGIKTLNDLWFTENKFKDYRTIHAAPPQAKIASDSSSVYVSMSAATAFRLKDSSNRTTGINSNGQVLENIPNSNFTSERLDDSDGGNDISEGSNSVWVHPVHNGDAFTVEITSSETVSDVIEISMMGPNGVLNKFLQIPFTSSPSAPSSYTFSYSDMQVLKGTMQFSRFEVGSDSILIEGMLTGGGGVYYPDTQDISVFVNGSAWKRNIPAGTFVHSGSDFVYEEDGDQPVRIVLYQNGLIHVEIHNFETPPSVPYTRSLGMAFLVGGDLFAGVAPKSERKTNKLVQIATTNSTVNIGARSVVSVELLNDLNGEYEYGVDVYLDGRQIATRNKTERLFAAEAAVSNQGPSYWEVYSYMVDRKIKTELSRGISKYSRENEKLRKLLSKELTEARRAQIEAEIERNEGFVEALNFQINQARIDLDGPVVLRINGETNEVSQKPAAGISAVPRSK